MLNQNSPSFFTADEEFNELCFEFGLELDEIVSYAFISYFLSSCSALTAFLFGRSLCCIISTMFPGTVLAKTKSRRGLEDTMPQVSSESSAAET